MKKKSDVKKNKGKLEKAPRKAKKVSKTSPTPAPDLEIQSSPIESTPDAPTPVTFTAAHPYWHVINEVIDPETGIGISDMGIIYDVQQKKGVVDVKMTLTSMGCPAGPDIVTNIDGVLRMQPGVKDVMIEVVWDPMWTPDRMQPDIRAMLFGGF